MRKIRMGMVGGGEGAFIGAVHRMAASIDGQVELVCGCFSADAERSSLSGEALSLPAERVYSDYQAMIAAEAARPANKRMEFLVIVTPNHLHLPVALAALAGGFHVMSDKPATLNLAEARQLRGAIEASGLLYGLTHTYAGYPMVREAQRLAAAGELGEIRKVVVEYNQGWLAAAAELAGNKQASWRTDPARAGASCTMADIGVHAFQMAEMVSGLAVTKLCADLGAVVEGRQLDDDGAVLLRFNNGARGVLMASQIAVGEENNLRLRIYGEKAALDWSHEDANTLWLKSNDQPARRLRTGWPGIGEDIASLTRLPAGHPEGYLEAFANLYKQFAQKVRQFGLPGEPQPKILKLPGIIDGLRGMAFIETVVDASNSDKKWHSMPVIEGISNE